jgi:hypothetical protein
MAKPAESRFGELHDPDVLAHLEAMTARLQPVRNVPSTASATDELPDWVEDL